MIHKILMTIMLMLCTVSTAFAQKKDITLQFDKVGSLNGQIPEFSINWEADLQAKGGDSYTLTLKITNDGGDTYILFGQSMTENDLKKTYMIKYDKIFSGDRDATGKYRVTTLTGNLRVKDPVKRLTKSQTAEICYENIANEIINRELKVACYKANKETEKAWWKRLFGVPKTWDILQNRYDMTFHLTVKIPVIVPEVHNLVLEQLEKETTDLLSKLKKVKICPHPKHKGGQFGQEKPHRDKIDDLISKIEDAKIDKDNAEKYDELISRLNEYTFRTYDCGRHVHVCGCVKDCPYCSKSWKKLLDSIGNIATAIANAKNKTEIENQKRIARQLKKCADKCKDRENDPERRKTFYSRINRLLE